MCHKLYGVNWRQKMAALLGVSAYAAGAPQMASVDLDDPVVVQARELRGGQLSPIPQTQTRWYLSDLEGAMYAADAGDIQAAAMLWKSCRRDGVLAGVLSTRTGGLVRLPKKFRGHAEAVRELQAGTDSIRSVFDEMFPPAELALLAADGLGIGVGVAELVPVQGRDFPVMVRLPPEFLFFRWSENRWYYRSIVGLIPITPGDGRWILHTPGGRVSPWQHGLWMAIGQSWIAKTHAQLANANWEAKLANPARVAIAPQGSTEPQRQSFFQKVMAWGVNTVFGLLPGWDVKILESNGRGYESFIKTIERSDREMIIGVAGQEVTVDGGAGFQNSDVHKSIRADLIKETADALAYTINTQGIPPWIVRRWGVDALANSAVVEWDVTPPKDRTAEGTALQTVGTAIKTLNEGMAAAGYEVDVPALADKFAIPIKKLERAAGPGLAQAKPRLELVAEGEEVAA